MNMKSLGFFMVIVGTLMTGTVTTLPEPEDRGLFFDIGMFLSCLGIIFWIFLPLDKK